MNTGGSVTFCNGNYGCSGEVSIANSLFGVNLYSNVLPGIIALATGNYVVNSPNWANGSVNGVGAVTFCDGLVGCTNASVSPVNSLIGSKVNDNIGYNGITALPNGNYLVSSQTWDNGSLINAGAITFCNGRSGCANQGVSSSNSLVGSKADDYVGYNRNGITIVPDGNYLVFNPAWSQLSPPNDRVGEITYGDSISGTVGAIT